MSNVKDVREKNTKLVLDGKEYELRYDLNAFAELEEIYGSVEKAMDKLEEGNLKGIRTLLWAGLIHEDENLTIKQVGAMITLDKLEQVSEAMTNAMELALPSVKVDDKDPN